MGTRNAPENVDDYHNGQAKVQANRQVIWFKVENVDATAATDEQQQSGPEHFREEECQQLQMFSLHLWNTIVNYSSFLSVPKTKFVELRDPRLPYVKVTATN
jgi:hypothetical protein